MTQLNLLTNEEEFVQAYKNNQDPTTPALVGNTTDLKEINLNWTEKQMPQRLRTKHVHGLHPYLGKFIPQLVEVFARKYFSPGQTVLDPFVGCGTTLVQSNELGINSIGYDISAFNALLCKVKTEAYDVHLVGEEANRILKITQQNVNISNGQMSLFENVDQSNSSQVVNDYLQAWFSPNTLEELLIYRNEINTGKYQYSDLLKIILTRSARSARQTTHFDLDFPKKPQTEPYWCYKHSRTCQPVDEAIKFLKRYTKDTIRRIQQFSQVRTNATVSVHHGDSRQVKAEGADGIITSPPYVGLIDYHDQHAYAYNLLELNDNSHREIGPASSGSSKSAKQQYQRGIADVFINMTKNLPKNAPIIIVAGDKHNLYPEIGQMANLKQETVLKRHVNRRTGRRASEFYESVFIWRKR